MHLMLDTLDVVGHLSLVMQKNAVTLAEVKDSIDGTSLSIHVMVVETWCKALTVSGSYGNQFKGVELNRQGGDTAAFNLIQILLPSI